MTAKKVAVKMSKKINFATSKIYDLRGKIFLKNVSSTVYYFVIFGNLTPGGVLATSMHSRRVRGWIYDAKNYSSDE